MPRLRLVKDTKSPPVEDWGGDCSGVRESGGCECFALKIGLL
jgi:hypothetical protein